MKTVIKILNQLDKAWQKHGFKLRNILDNYCIDEKDLPLLSEQLDSTLNCDSGLFLCDTSGLAAHMLGLRLIEAWQQDRILKKYAQVLWLPYAKLLTLPIMPNEEHPPSLKDLESLLGHDTSYEEGKTTLVIITGIDYLNYDKMKEQPFTHLATAWLELIKTLPWLAIGNFVPDEFKTASSVMNISLPPLYLNMHYKIDDSENEEEVSFPGTLLIDLLRAHTQAAFRFNPDAPDGVFTISKSTLSNYFRGNIAVATETREEIKHAQPLLSGQEFIKLLAGTLSPNEISFSLPVLDTPSKWYYAALSAAQVHAADSKKKFFLYEISDHLIVRRMTASSMHYVSDLGPTNQYLIRSATSMTHTLTEEIQWILNAVLARDDFENLENKDFNKAFEDAKKAWRDQATDKRNTQLIAEGKNLPHKPHTWSDDVEKNFKAVCSLFKNDLTDKELTEGMKSLTDDEKDASYQTMQANINQLDPQQISAVMRNILIGTPIAEEAKACRFMLAANMIAESARDQRSFFAPFAMLTLMSSPTKVLPEISWQRFVALPERIKIDIKTADWTTLIIADGLDALGGLHPMAHNGSFFQTQPQFSHGGKKPSHGIAWPEFKMQILYAYWLAASLRSHGMGISLRSHSLSFMPLPNEKTLKKSDQLFIMRDFELLARLEKTYNVRYDDQKILTNIARPFAQALHLIADPKQIKIMPCDSNAEFGYFLVIPKSIDGSSEEQFIHMDNVHAMMIALKLDAIDDHQKASKLYNYLCMRHPHNIAYRYSRALFLVFHPDLITQRELRQYGQIDIDFLKTLQINTSLELKKQFSYISAIYSLRVACEQQFPEDASTIRYKMLTGALNKALKIEKEFSETDEESPMLSLTIATAYWMHQNILTSTRDLKSCLSRDPMLMIAYNDLHLAHLHLVKHALTLHRTWETAQQGLNKLFNELIKNAGIIELTSIRDSMNIAALRSGASPLEIFSIFSNFNLSDENRKFINDEELSMNLNILLNSFLSIIASFKPHMDAQREKIVKIVKETKSTRNISHKPIIRNLENMSQETLTYKIIRHMAKHDAIVITFNWQIPFNIIYTWARRLNIEIGITYDSSLGICVYVRLNPGLTKRAAYQPIPHPNSFLFSQHNCIETTDQAYFSKLSDLFKECLQRLENWQPSDGSQQRISYHLFGNRTLLPALLLVQRKKNIQDVLIEMPNGIPVKIVLDWLKEKNFAFYWVNDEDHGRCLCLPEINISKKHTLFNSATSNGELIESHITCILKNEINQELPINDPKEKSRASYYQLFTPPAFEELKRPAYLNDQDRQKEKKEESKSKAPIIEINPYLKKIIDQNLKPQHFFWNNLSTELIIAQRHDSKEKQENYDRNFGLVKYTCPKK